MPLAADSIEARIAALLVDILKPLSSASASQDSLIAFGREFGWELDALGDLTNLLGSIEPVVTAVENLTTIVDTADGDWFEIVAGVAQVSIPAAAIVDTIARWRPVVIDEPPDRVAAELAADLAAHLLASWMRRRKPVLRAAFACAGVVRELDVPQLGRDHKVLRHETKRPVFDLQQLLLWLTDPPAALNASMRALTQRDGEWAELAQDAWIAGGPLITRCLEDAGLPVAWAGPAGANATGTMLLTPGFPPMGEDTGIAGTLALAVTSVGIPPTLGIVGVLEGDFKVIHDQPRWTASLEIDSTGAVIVSRNEVVADSRSTITMLIRTKPGGRALILGFEDGPHLVVDSMSASVSITLEPSKQPTPTIIVAFRGVSAGLGSGGGDSFLQSLFGTLGGGSSVDVELNWSRQRGLELAGSADLSITLIDHLVLGPIELKHVVAGLVIGDRLGVRMAGDIAGHLGPVNCDVIGIGVEASLRPGDGALGAGEIAIRSVGPKGIGLSLDIGAVRGSGSLIIDAEAGQYVGVVHLSIVDTISVTAIGIITTKLPDGTDGFALLIIVTVEGFTPIQLGMGFTISGFGGLFALNRTASIPALRGGVRTGALKSVLFPKDPAIDTPKLVSDLNGLFPVSPGHFLAGPMVIVGWGSPNLVRLELGLILEFPDFRILILGRLSAAFPNPASPVVVLNLDSFGLIDIPGKELSLDATLYDSRIAMFSISGDMAMRISWGDDPQFLLSVGGYHPRFKAPPSFPQLRRLSIALASSDNPRISLDLYIAITSNTIQTGATLELYAEKGPFAIEAHLGFDTMIQFRPFGFVVDVSAGASIRLGGVPILVVALDLSLSGPSPWHAEGNALITFLVWSVSAHFEITIGEHGDEPLEGAVDVGERVREALSNTHAWSVNVPGSFATALVMRPISPGELPDDAILTHPLANVSVRQTVAPLGYRMSKFGQSAVTGPDTLQLQVLAQVASGELVTHELREHFAIGQFTELTASERLSAPSFALLSAGVELAVDVHRSGATIDSPIGYETIIIDDDDDEPGAP